MARKVKPLYDFDKCFEIYFKNDDEYDEFEEKGSIWGYEPFQEYMENFDDTYVYWVTYSVSHGIFSGSTYCYTVHICKIKDL